MTNSFTLLYSQKVYSIETVCKVSSHFIPDANHITHPPFRNYSAIWDTGAVMTVISSKLVKELNLFPCGKRTMIHANGNSYVNVYFINVLLPNNVEIQALQVMEGQLEDTDLLLGMDVIGLGDFALTSPNACTQMSFSMPPTHNTDYSKI